MAGVPTACPCPGRGEQSPPGSRGETCGTHGQHGQGPERPRDTQPARLPTSHCSGLLGPSRAAPLVWAPGPRLRSHTLQAQSAWPAPRHASQPITTGLLPTAASQGEPPLNSQGHHSPWKHPATTPCSCAGLPGSTATCPACPRSPAQGPCSGCSEPSGRREWLSALDGPTPSTPTWLTSLSVERPLFLSSSEFS